MHSLFQDLRYGARMLISTPGLTVVAVLSLALGIGANTALFSVVDALLLKKLAVREPDQLVLFKWLSGPNFSPGSYTGSGGRDPSGLNVRTSFPYLTYKQFREQGGVLTDVFAFGNVSVNMNADGQADVATGQAVSGNYYRGLGVEALHGRTITDEDDVAAATPVAVLSHRYWQRRFGGNPSVVGKQVAINNVPFIIVGVTPPGFEGTMQVGSSQDVTIPIAFEPAISSEPERSRMYGAGIWWLRLMGRLKPGATAEQAQAGLEGLFHATVLEHRAARSQTMPAQRAPVPQLDPNDYPRLGVDSGSRGEMNTREYFAPSLYILLGVVGLVLLIACANVANLLLACAASRQREIAVRLALGAGRGRLIRQLLTESVLLAATGGALGVLLALWIMEGLLAVDDWSGPWQMTALDPSLDLRVLGFTLALSLLTGIVFGLAPAWRATGVDLAPSLKNSAWASGGASRSLLSRSLVVAQVAMSLLLLIGAGLFLRTLLNLQRIDIGFNARNLLLFSVDPSLIGYKDDRLASLYERMCEHIEAVPGVRHATFSRIPLLAQSMSSTNFYLAGARTPEGKARPAEGIHIHQVRENFFEAMEIPLLLGRALEARDNQQAPKVAVVNQAFADKFLPGENPIGKRLGRDADKADDIEIVGIARDAKYSRQRDDVPPTIYLPWLQELRSLGSATFEVRTESDPSALVAAIRDAVRDVDGNLPLNNIRTQIEQADDTLAMERLFAKLLSLFGLLAQQLASIGLYGVLAWSVSRRTREIGIRMAVGADRRDVLKMVLRQGMTLTMLGVALGLAGAYVLIRYLESVSTMLYGVDTTDPLTFGVVALLLTAVALIACYIPARRATRVDPMTALRYE